MHLDPFHGASQIVYLHVSIVKLNLFHVPHIDIHHTIVQKHVRLNSILDHSLHATRIFPLVQADQIFSLTDVLCQIDDG